MKPDRGSAMDHARVDHHDDDEAAAGGGGGSVVGCGSGKTKKSPPNKPKASVAETLRFVFDCGARVRIIFLMGWVGAVLNGLVYPCLAYVFSNSLADLSGTATNGLNDIRRMSFIFMGLGTWALLWGTVQSWCFEIAAYHGSQNYRLQLFRALLRQDAAFFDVYDIAGIAAQVGPNSNHYRRGIGRKAGEGIQYLTSALGGISYALYSSWRCALVILALLPFVFLSASMTLRLNQTKGERAAAAYSRAGGVAYSAVAAIRTVLSLNAIEEMVHQYAQATEEAFRSAKSVLVKQGFANGSMQGSFLMLFAVLTLYGSSLLYRNVAAVGCDPSGGVLDNIICDASGADVFGAMLGVAFASQGASQFGNFSEAFAAARVAVYEAMKAIRRKPGAPVEVIYKTEHDNDDLGTTTHSSSGRSSIVANQKTEEIDPEMAEKEVRAILPTYEIDSSSSRGLKPTEVNGALSFKRVTFCYPSRPADVVLNELSLDIQPGQVHAFVGPSGSGKSSIVALIERFYDPHSGSIELDGVNLKDINVSYLRKVIGYVGQEPTLFATTIRQNIQYGNLEATQEQIEAAARMANAHDFISSFTNGYDTQVGDKGCQLSGGQKQRIAIARVLVGNPRILLLDEATSALDAESELVVQDALDNILEQKNITTIIIAHRLSTIRNADKINVISAGQVIESGTHDELMGSATYYRKLVMKQEGPDERSSSISPGSSRRGSEVSLEGMLPGQEIVKLQGDEYSLPHIEFKNVNFAYPTRPKKKIFDGFSLSIRSGETVALCGPSGQGKSTTVALIERFYDPVDGVVEYMGHDIRTLNVKWYRDQIGFVSQEPTLFNDTIANNILYGAQSGGATRAEIEEAAKQANAHEFIMDFPEGYDTYVGERGAQLSGGQKQRIAIARALVKKPQVLVLDEATSALDNESEAIVQAAVDRLMQSRDHTVIIIAHRLSTIRNADRIGFVAGGRVLEYGTHDELYDKPNGRYRRLVDSSKRRSTLGSVGLGGLTGKDDGEEEEDEETDWEALLRKEEESSFSSKRARDMAKKDSMYLFLGSVGGVMAGSVFPVWGIMQAETINLLFSRVPSCSEGNIPVPGFATCEDYWEDVAGDMRRRSFEIAGYWACVVFGAIAGNMLTVWGFGNASERLNKRVRDLTFSALLRQEVAFFDKRSVGSITSELADDAARLHAFTGEPVRAFVMAMSSVVIGTVISFVYMWPFALVILACIPFLVFSSSVRFKTFVGENIGAADAADGLNTPGGIVVETLLNIRTVSALTLEKRRYEDYEKALLHSEPSYKLDAFVSGLTSGLAVFIHQWINGLQLWYGGYLIFNYPHHFGFFNFLVAKFSIMMAMLGMGAAFQDISNRQQVEKSAGRIFYLLDRKSEIDPLSSSGKVVA